MGLFGKIANAKASFGQDYAKPGTYYLILDAAKKTTHSQKGVEQAIFEFRVLHVVDPALWTGPAAEVPKGKGGQALLNLPGKEPKPGDPCNFVYQDGTLGNENRAKKMIITLDDCSDDDFPKDEAIVAGVFDPESQPYKNCVIELRAGEQNTKTADASGNKKIVGTNPIRRVYAEDLRQMWEAKKFESKTIDILSKDGLLEKMLQQDKEEKEAKASA